MAKRPPVGINPSIPIEIQRELRKVAGYAFDAQDRADRALGGLKTKVSKNQKDLLEVSQFVSKQVQASGQHPINLTGLALGPTGIKAGTYTFGSNTIEVNSAGQITKIT